ncbi:MAG TPA: GAF domain-containing protein [Terriglobales bacterium]|nr:GAF domain-containing protein [Terriglobales bacterium]
MALFAMNISILCAWHAVGDITVPRLMAQESAALIMLAASLLVFRTFRERYLLLWILGWLASFVSRWTLRGQDTSTPPHYLTAISHAEFVLAVCLFAAAVFIYTHARKLLLPLVLISFTIIGLAVSRALLWPDSITLRAALEVSYRLIAFSAAFQLIRFRWARWEIGPWLLSASLLLLHLKWEPVSVHFPPGSALITNLLLGLSMLLVVFDDYKMRTRRLGVINALTTSITRAQQHGPMMVTALEELKGLMCAKAAWFRLLEGDRMVMAQQIGLSQDFLRDRSSVPKDETLGRALKEGEPTVVKTSAAGDAIRPYLKKERFHHVVIVPVLGKKSVIGTLSLGSRHRLSYAPEDMEFLTTSAHQLGLAFENLRLVEQILRSHRQWTNTFDSIHDFVLLHDSEFRVMKANHALLQRLGQAPADVVGQLCEQVLPRVRSEWKGCPYCHGAEEGFYEGDDPCFGGFSMISTSSYTDQGAKQKGTIHVIRDTTDRRMAEEKYRLLFEQVQEGVFVATPDGKLLDCNDAFIRMLGYTQEELAALNIDSELYASIDQRDTFRREVELHNYVRNFEVTLRKKDGTLLTAVESSFASRDSAGKIERYQGFLLDMTEKKRAEDEIRRRNRELNALNAMAVIATQSFDLDEILNLTLRQVISLLGAETGSIYLSDSDETTFRRRAGWGQRSVDRARFFEIKIVDFGDLVTRSRTEVITAEYLPHLPALVADFIRADGLASWIWVLLWGKDKPMGIMGISSRESREYTSNDENLLVAIGRQLSTTIEKVRLYEETCRAYEDLRRTQEQLLQSEKMSAVGQLIAGVAHELNNPLTAILGYAQLLESEGLGERAADFVSKLFKQAQRTHRVVQNLLSFARQRKPHRQEIDVCRVLEETLTLRDYDLKVNDIKLEREIASDVPAVTADSHQLEQVFLNLINNAVDAMLEAGQGGVLKVRVYLREGKVHIEFADSGPGIKEPNRIFDPFYTTKSVGKGTGLGLSICYGIIKEHGGEISARNRKEGGAIIEVSLPSAGCSVSPETALPAPRADFAIEGRILLVEDEEAVLEFERDVLAGAGAQVVTLMNGEQVKARLLSETFDALIIDGKMPGGWNAPEVYRWIAEKCPGLEKHLLFTFSAVAEPETRAFLHRNNLPYLVKPFEVADLISQARRLLQKSRATAAG